MEFLELNFTQIISVDNKNLDASFIIIIRSETCLLYIFLDLVPCLILFHEGRPHIYKGEISDENEAIKWFRKKLVSFDEL